MPTPSNESYMSTKMYCPTTQKRYPDFLKNRYSYWQMIVASAVFLGIPSAMFSTFVEQENFRNSPRTAKRLLASASSIGSFTAGGSVAGALLIPPVVASMAPSFVDTDFRILRILLCVPLVQASLVASYCAFSHLHYNYRAFSNLHYKVRPTPMAAPSAIYAAMGNFYLHLMAIFVAGFAVVPGYMVANQYKLTPKSLDVLFKKNTSQSILPNAESRQKPEM